MLSIYKKSIFKPIKSFTVKQEQGIDLENKPKITNVFQVFRMRWPIEVMFYQEKPFGHLENI